MNIDRIKILLLSHRKLLLLFPALVMVLVFVMIWNKPREYTSRALLYTGFASGYNLESPEGGVESDFASANSAFDNLINTIKAQSTLEEASILLLAGQLIALENNPDSLDFEELEFLQKNFGSNYRKQLVTGNSLERLVKVLSDHLQGNDEAVRNAIRSSDSPLGVTTIRDNLQASRLGSGDMLEITYKASHARDAQSRLALLIHTIIDRYKLTKSGEIKSVVAYFEGQLESAGNLLKKKEDSLEMFSSANKIIDYDEDSKSFSAQRKDIEDRIQEEASALAASEAALRQLNSKLAHVKDLAARNTSFNAIRDSLSMLQAQLIVEQKSFSKKESSSSALGRKIQELEAKLMNELIGLSASSNSQEGVPSRMLLATWVDTMLEVDKSRARLRSLREMQSSKAYDLQAIIPVGLTLSRLKRDIKLAETSYLEILHNLNASRLREQNINTSLSLRVLDAPTLPEKPESSKKILVVALAFIASFLLVSGYIVGRDFLDTTIKDPESSEAKLGIPFAGALTYVAAANDDTAKIDLRLLNQLINTIHIHFKEEAKPLVIVLFSTQAGDGKTYFGKKLWQQLNASGYQTRLTFYTDGEEISPSGNREATKLIAATEGIKTSDEVVLIEISSVSQHVLPIHLLKRADVSLIVVGAHRPWTPADSHQLKIYLSGITHPAFSVLNRVTWPVARWLLGDSGSSAKGSTPRKSLDQSTSTRSTRVQQQRKV